jgi:hypothetical protein
MARIATPQQALQQGQQKLPVAQSATRKIAAASKLQDSSVPLHPVNSRGLVAASAVELPLSRIPVPLCCKAAGASEFAWASLKTKMALQEGAFGPDSGATWLWFLVAEMLVTPVSEDSRHYANVRIIGNKFQAGWVPEFQKNLSSSVLQSRHHSMLQSALDGTQNQYGSGRGGTPEGFSHAWNYSDSDWMINGVSSAVSRARWSEVKGKDRWRVDVSMLWREAGKINEGRHLLVAEQRAEKLNPNQYATAMRGAMVPIGSDVEGKEALLGLIKLYSNDNHKKASVSGDSGLMRWAKKRPADSLAPDNIESVQQVSPEKQ